MIKYLFLPIPAIALLTTAALAQDPAKTGASVAVGNESVIEQIGSSNGASADQSKVGGGSGNYSEICQGLNNNASSGNSATVQQVAAGGAKNAARTSQDGGHNLAVTQQNTNATGAGTGFVTFTMPLFTFTNSSGFSFLAGGSTSPEAKGSFTSTIEQNGNNNKAGVSQGIWGDAAATGTDYSFVSQHASNAKVEVNQLGASNNWSSVSQEASGSNYSQVNQDGSAGSNNVSFLDQAYPVFYANINQHALGGNNASYITQSGGAINLTQTAWHGANNSGIYEIGNNGALTVNQSVAHFASSGSNDSTIWQNNVTATVSVTQNVAPFGSGNNTSDITQTGGSYTVNQTADGGNNVSNITSNGGTSNITQTASLGFTNESTVIQSGNNSANVTQSMDNNGGNNISFINQTLIGGSTQNQATVVQVANYGLNYSNVTQTGYGNTAYVHQH